MTIEIVDPIGDNKNLYLIIDFKIPRWLKKPKEVEEYRGGARP